MNIFRITGTYSGCYRFNLWIWQPEGVRAFTSAAEEKRFPDHRAKVLFLL
jgi:hypothetical protein